MPITFKDYIENRRAMLTGNAQERRLGLIETEAMSIAYRELSNAKKLARAFAPADKISLDNLLALQNLLASLYVPAIHELMARGEIDRPGVPTELSQSNKEGN